MTSKAVLLADGEMAPILSVPSTVNPARTACQVYMEALYRAGIDQQEVSYIVGTGYGRTRVDFAHENVSEISCHAKGAHHLLPDARTVIDIGGQGSKAIRLDGFGKIKEVVTDDNCAAGNGALSGFHGRIHGHGDRRHGPAAF